MLYSAHRSKISIKNCITILFLTFVSSLITVRAESNENSRPENQLPSSDGWWEGFGDPGLTYLIQRATDVNYDLKAAVARIRAARQGIRIQRAGYWPAISLDAGWNAQGTPAGRMAGNGKMRQTSQYYSAGASMQWEIDIFGRTKSRIRSAEASLQLARAQRVGALQSICSEVALDYVDLRMAQARLRVAREQARRQRQVLGIAEARHEAGLNSKLDVAQARTIYNSTLASIPVLENQISAMGASLAALTGIWAGTGYIGEMMADTAARMPDYRKIPTSEAAPEMLRRRPDILEAEAQVEAAAAQLGIAKKEYLPTLSLEGSIGTAAHHPDNLFAGSSMSWAIGPRLSWTLFDGFARRAATAQAREDMEAAMDTYNQTLLTAYSEVYAAMADYRALVAEAESLECVLKDAEEQLSLSVDLYKQGLDAFLPVAQAQISCLEYADRLVATRGQATQALITLYKALGGGWTLDNDAE